MSSRWLSKQVEWTWNVPSVWVICVVPQDVHTVSWQNLQGPRTRQREAPQWTHKLRGELRGI